MTLEHVEEHRWTRRDYERLAAQGFFRPGQRKIPLYARSGIPEAWLCNLARRAYEVYRDPENGIYQTRLVLRAGDTVSPLSQPEACLEISDLLP